MNNFQKLAAGALAVSMTVAAGTSKGRPMSELATPASPEPIEVTMYQLITTPERYDGRVVQVIGVGHFDVAFGPENLWALFATSDDEKHSTCGLIRVADLAPSLQRQKSNLAALSEQYLIVEGKFEAAPPLPPDVIVLKSCPGSGALRGVTRLERWEFGD